MRSFLSVGIVGAAAFAAVASAVKPEGVVDGGFQTFALPEFPNHAIRMKEQNDTLCDAGSKQYTGWLDVGGRHLFFWYFESLSKPETDPLMVWLNGGPGGSSMIGLLMELGPCLINKNGTGTYRNEHSWTSNASVMFIDQPAPVGFSWVDDDVDDGDIPSDSFAAADDTVIFMKIFYEAFPHFHDLDFHIAGESYGGHYIPAWSSAIVRYNALQSDPGKQIPLKSILIGNGYVDPFATIWGYYDTLCTTKPGVPEPVFNETRCTHLAEVMPRCAYLSEACVAFPDPVVCLAVSDFCTEQVMMPYMNEVLKGERNFYDITAGCDFGELCYAEIPAIDTYLNTDWVWDAMEVPRHHVKNYSCINEEVTERFAKGVDIPLRLTPQVKFVLEAGVDVLVYNGNYDLACNTWGNLRWTARLPWAGQMEYATKPLMPWYANIEGKSVVAGTMKEVRAGRLINSKTDKKAGRFSFVSIDKGGHMVPMDQPEASLQMLQTWLAGGDFALTADVTDRQLFGSEQVIMGEL